MSYVFSCTFTRFLAQKCFINSRIGLKILCIVDAHIQGLSQITPRELTGMYVQYWLTAKQARFRKRQYCGQTRWFKLHPQRGLVTAKEHSIRRPRYSRPNVISCCHFSRDVQCAPPSLSADHKPSSHHPQSDLFNHICVGSHGL